MASSPDPTPAELSGKGKKLSAPATSASSSTFGHSESVQQKVTTPLEDAEYLNPLPIPEFSEIKMPPSLADLVSSFESTKEKGGISIQKSNILLARRNDRTFVNSMIDLSFLNLPDAVDSAK